MLRLEVCAFKIMWFYLKCLSLRFSLDFQLTQDAFCVIRVRFTLLKSFLKQIAQTCLGFLSNHSSVFFPLEFFQLAYAFIYFIAYIRALDKIKNLTYIKA